MTKLTDLIGLHTLSGFDTSIYNRNNCQEGVCFILNGKNYQIYTDKCDGFRSYLSELFEENVECKNLIPKEYVLIVEDHADYTDGIIIYSLKGKMIAHIATQHYDEFYPYIICEWHPENLISNDKTGSKVN